MRKYWALAKTSFSELFAYRLNYWFEVGGGMLFTLVTIWFWQAVVGGRNGLGGYSSPELITYLIGTGLVTSFLFITNQADGINDDINHGFLSSTLVKPIRPFWGSWFIRDQVRKSITLMAGALGFCVIAVFYHRMLVLPASLFHAALLFFLLIAASVLHFLLYAQFALFAFWSEQTWGERFFLRVFGELASGVLIPLTFLPHVVERAFQFLPFRFFAYVPMQVYLGKIDSTTIARESAVLLLWIGILVLTTKLTMRRGLRVYTGEGI